MMPSRNASGGRVGLRFDPVGGGQFKQAVQQMVEAERQPIKNLEARKAREEARMKLFQEFKGKVTSINNTLSEFTNFKKFRDLKADLGDGSTLCNVTIDKDKAEPGTYSLQIDQLAERTSLITNGFSDPDANVMGIGFIVADLKNGDSAEIFIDEDHSSLHGIAGQINQRQDLPFRASVVKDMSDPEKPWRIIVSARGDKDTQELVFPELYFLDGTQDLYIDDQHESQNALLKLDGFEIEAEQNDISEFLQGVNLHLKQAREGQAFTLTITQDHKKMSGKMKGLVDQVNGVLDFINKQNKIDDKSDTKSTFAGDTGLQNIEYRIRNLLHEGFPSTNPDTGEYKFVFLNQMGVEFDKTGQLKFSEEKFEKVLESDFDSVAEAITGGFGFAAQLREVIDGYTRVGNGLLTVREQGLRQRIQKLDSDIAEKERRVDQKAQALTQQFARLEASLAGMQRQQAYLSATMPGGGGGNLVSQLLGG
jgi:flagellar hook-associated protein 2